MPTPRKIPVEIMNKRKKAHIMIKREEQLNLKDFYLDKLGLDEGQSIFTTPSINKKYYFIKKDCVKTFNE